MRKRKVTPFLFLFIIVAILAFFGIQYLTKTGIFKIWGVVTYDENLRKDEIEFLDETFKDVRLEDDVKISAVEKTEATELENSILYEVYVPVADFYDSRSKITTAELEKLELKQSDSDETYLLKISDLDSSVKLLAVDENYYLDTFSSGAIFRYLVFGSKNPEESLTVVKEKFEKTFPKKDEVLSFAQTGVTALTRAMYTKLKQVGNAAYFAANIKDFLSSKDLTHISNEASFTNLASGSNICAAWSMFDAIAAIGTDIVELTGNHNNDCGTNTNLETIAFYKEKGLKMVGGGENATEAAKPLEISEKGTNITMLAYNYSTGGYTTGNKPGANLYSEEKAKKDIAAAKERGDFVIVDFQYFECYCYPDEGQEMPRCDKTIASTEYGEYPNQKELFRRLIDLGADVVVGTSAHQPQTYEKYNDGEIYYGLGNLFFDQTYWPGTTRGIILTHYFLDGKLLQTRFSPTVYGKALQVELMSEEDSQWLINRLNAAR